MIEIIPAIMPENFKDLEAQLARVKDFVASVQIDVMDGKFVPSKDWPYVADQGEFERLLGEEEGLPFWDSLDYEVDLMVENPEEVVDAWKRIGVGRIIIHIESTKNMEQILKMFPEGSASFIELGIAIGTTTPVGILDPYMNHVSFVQCMGIEKIGYQGQPFDERVLTHISSIREKYPEVIISVDGGVNLETAPRLIAAGATRLVSGSAIFESESIAETLKQLQSL